MAADDPTEPPKDPSSKRDLTRALNELGPAGLPSSAQAELVAELRKLAASHMERERSGHTLQVTALLNEAYLKLSAESAGEASSDRFPSRGHFFALASRTMRSILIDHARRTKSKKRGGDWTRVTLSLTGAIGGSADARTGHTVELLDLADALDDLMNLRPDLAEIIDLRFFGGLDVPSLAETLDVSTRTVERRLRAATAWLVDRLEEVED